MSSRHSAKNSAPARARSFASSASMMAGSSVGLNAKEEPWMTSTSASFLPKAASQRSYSNPERLYGLLINIFIAPGWRASPGGDRRVDFVVRSRAFVASPGCALVKNRADDPPSPRRPHAVCDGDDLCAVLEQDSAVGGRTGDHLRKHRYALEIGGL